MKELPSRFRLILSVLTLEILQQRYLREPHVLLGLVILCGILLQNTLGWLHHRAYVNDAKNAFVTSAHILVGRFIIILGSANALL